MTTSDRSQPMNGWTPGAHIEEACDLIEAWRSDTANARPSASTITPTALTLAGLHVDLAAAKHMLITRRLP